MASSAQIHALFTAAPFCPSPAPGFFSSRSSFVGFRPTPAFTSLCLSRYIPSRYGGPVCFAAEKVVGVDLGTNNSVTAVMEGGKPTIITNTEGQRTASSVVAYTKNGDRLVGQIAKRKLPIDSSHRWWSSATVATVTGSNRGIGFEIAWQLAEHGLTVIVASRDPVQGRAAADGLREHWLSVDSWQLDVSDASSVGSFAQWVVDKYGGLDILGCTSWRACPRMCHVIL